MSANRVWDPFVRIGQWLLAAAFLVAYLTGEEWLTVHVVAGHVLAGVVVFRLGWGVIGTPPARFRSFVRPFAAVRDHLRDLARLRARPYAGHNPAGGWMVVALLSTLVLLSLSGLAVLGSEGGGPLAGTAFATTLGEEGWEEVHEVLANLALGLVVVHVAGVLVESMLTGENLVRSMVDGMKRPARREGTS